MRRSAILLTIGILWLGGLHSDFAVADGHTGFQGQVESICSTAHSPDNSCQAYINQSEIINSTFNNYEKTFLKAFNSSFITSLSTPYDGRQVGRKFSENQLIDGVTLTGIVIKRE